MLRFGGDVDTRLDRLRRRCAAQRGLLALGGGLPAESAIPKEALTIASARALAEPSMAALQYGWPEGDGALRDWIARRLSARGRRTNAREVIVTAGAQQALAITSSLLREVADTISCPDACYPGALDAFRAARLSLVAPGDPSAQAHYRMTGTDNPTGAPFDVASSLALTDAPLVLDEAYAELVFDGHVAIPEELAERSTTWWVGTFSKTLAPGLRVGWLVPPAAYRARAVAAKRDLDLQTNSMSQRVLVHLLDAMDYDAHLERVRALYARRARTLHRALQALFPAWRIAPPTGGFSMWIDTGIAGSEVDLLGAAMAEGVSFDPGGSFRRARARSDEAAPIALRICWSSVGEAELACAARRLRRAWRRFVGV